MRRCVEAIKPDAIVHLGDHYDDGAVLAETYPHIPLHQVPGNCDRYRCIGVHPEVLCYSVCGVRLFMTHGHNHGVKSGVWRLREAAAAAGAAAALYGHTHIPHVSREGALWLVNPGSCGSMGGSCAVVETENGSITACHILRQADLEENV